MLKRHLSIGAKSLASTYFITTPIFYVNASPHLGHLASALLADCQARFRLLRDKKTEVLFSTGTDEHGLKIKRAAEKFQISPLTYADAVSEDYQKAFRTFGITHTHFVRTTGKEHRATVEWLWSKLEQGGHIYKASHEGWYCVPDETFVTESQLVTAADGVTKVSSESGHPVEWAEEENYIFRLSGFQQELLDYLDQSVIQPVQYRGHLNFVLANLIDLSVSRSASRLDWGIPVPNDPSQTIYVWLDALANYLTVSGLDPVTGELKVWPPDCHVVGKDILKFHAIYWPAFLMGVGLEPPRKIFCHSHWMIDNEKMSKSKGNIVDPVKTADEVTVDGLRYFLLRQGTPHSDSNFSKKQLVKVLNAELANTLGNLLGRCTGKVVNPEQRLPKWTDESLSLCSENCRSLISQGECLADEVQKHFEDFNFYMGIEKIMEFLRNANSLQSEEEPWKLIKTGEKDRAIVLNVIGLESVRVAAILLQPVIPHLSDVILTKLGVSHRDWSAAQTFAWKTNVHYKFSDEKVVLFRKLNA